MTQKRKIVIICIYSVLLATAIFFLRPRPAPTSDILEVPLGVEEAVIIAFDGGPIEPVPFAWGVGVNVRLAGTREVEGGRVYDVRYILNRAGDFDLKDYFRFTDGKPAQDLPSFKVRGLERLSKDIAAQIAETEDTRVGLHAWYYETLSLLGVAWIGWLLLLIFWGRRRKHDAAPQHAAPTLADQIRVHLLQFESGSLDKRQQAQLELMIFRQWREQRSLANGTMAESLAAFRADPEVADAYAELENWLHRPAPPASPAQVADAVRSRLEKTAAPRPMETVPS